MRLMVQEHLAGCGLACIACIAGRSYKEVFKLANTKHATKHGYYCTELVAVLARLKLKYRYARIKDRKFHNKSGTIVFIDKCKKYPIGHYLTLTKNGWMNPWINFPCITPAKAGYQRKLSGRPIWEIYPV